MPKTDAVPPTIALLTPDDWATARTLRLNALHTNPEAFGAPQTSSDEWTETMWRTWVSTSTVIAARVGTRPAGIARLQTVPVRTSFHANLTPNIVQEWESVERLTSVWVNPGFRGRGVGDALMEAVKRTHAPHLPVFFSVYDEAGNALRLYQRHGYTIIHTWYGSRVSHDMLHHTHLPEHFTPGCSSLLPPRE